MMHRLRFAGAAAALGLKKWRSKKSSLTVCGKSHPWPFSTKSTAGNAEGFLGQHPPHPAADHFVHSLLTLWSFCMPADPCCRNCAPVSPVRVPMRGLWLLLLALCSPFEMAMSQDPPADPEAVAGGGAGAVEAAAKQSFGADPLKTPAWTKIEQEYKEPLRGGGAFDATAREFVVKKALPQLGIEANRPIIDRVRRRLREALLNGIADDKAFDDASKAVAEAALVMARDPKISPIVRVNAMLLVGELRQKDAREGGVWEPAAVLLAASAADGKLPLGVRVAALAGLSRHAEAAKKAGGTKPADLAKAARAAVGAIVEEPASADRSVAAEWMAARALALLPAVMQPLPRETAAAVVAILNDSSRSIDVRVRAAAALGALVGPKSEVNPPAVIEAVRKLAIAALAADEAAANERRFDEEYRMLTSGGGQVGGATRYAPPRAAPVPLSNPNDPGIIGGPLVPEMISEQACRRAAWRLVTVADSLVTADEKAGLATLLPPNELASAKKLAATIRAEGVKIHEDRTEAAILDALDVLDPEGEAGEGQASSRKKKKPAAAPEEPAETDLSPFPSPFAK